MDYKDIKKLIDDMGDSKLDSLDIEFPDGIKISMTKNKNNVIAAPAPMTVPVVQNVVEKSLVANAELQTTEMKVVEEGQIVKSPMVGTFYLKPSPTAKEYVQVGDTVKKGTILCIIEAMKLMNEIESEYEGEIAEIYVKDGETVEYGMPLFRIK